MSSSWAAGLARAGERRPAAEVHSSLPYALPFAILVGLLMLQRFVPDAAWPYPAVLVAMAAAIGLVSRPVLSFRVARPGLSIGLGILVCLIWIAPEALWPGYRQHWLFQNPATGALRSTLPVALRGSTVVLLSRFLRAMAIVPIVEELFWRAWLPRWIVTPRFWELPLGRFTPTAFWLTAALFASEHGPYWEVGLVAGIGFNLLLMRTRSLGDCILAHAVANALLSVYVVWSRHWELWY